VSKERDSAPFGVGTSRVPNLFGRNPPNLRRLLEGALNSKRPRTAFGDNLNGISFKIFRTFS